MAEQHQEDCQHHVCVWFGHHLVAHYVADPPAAADYEAAMRRRFAGLRVTNEPLVGASVSEPMLPLLKRRLWELMP